jgi:hypothetical protein
MIERTKAALKKGGTLKALLWYQGESDCEDKSNADHYEQRLIVFFNNVRADLDKHDLPIIQVSILTILLGHDLNETALVKIQMSITDLPHYYTCLVLYLHPQKSNNAFAK